MSAVKGDRISVSSVVTVNLQAEDAQRASDALGRIIDLIEVSRLAVHASEELADQMSNGLPAVFGALSEARELYWAELSDLRVRIQP